MLNEFRQHKGHRDIQLRGVSLHVINVPNNQPSPVWMWCVSHFGLPMKKFCLTQIFLVPPSAEPGDDPVAPGLLPTASLPHLVVKYNLCVKGCVPVSLFNWLHWGANCSLPLDMTFCLIFFPFFFTREFDLWLWKIIVFFRLIVIIAIITNYIIFSHFYWTISLSLSFSYVKLWFLDCSMTQRSCDTTRLSSFLIAASQGFRDSLTLLLHSLPSWYHPHLFRFFNFKIHSALKQEIQGSWDTTLIVVSFVSTKEKIHHYSKKSMLASVVDAYFPISHQCDVVKCPLFLTRF